MPDAYQLTPEFVKEWNRIRRKVDSIKFVGISGSNLPDSISIGPPSQGAKPLGLPFPDDNEFVLTGTRTKGGCYTANPTYFVPFDTSASGALTESSVQTADTSTTVYLVNKREYGSSAHALSTSGTPKTVRGWFGGYDTGNGTPIYIIDECQ